MNNEALSRRQFIGRWVPLGASLVATATTIAVLSGTPTHAATLMVKLPDGTTIPALGQGSADLGQGRHPELAETEALRVGLSLGMRLIDTAEIYGGGRSEELIGSAIKGRRDLAFIVSKVRPDHATANGIAQACEASLRRLGTDHLDLYLLHWPRPGVNLVTMVAAFENLRAAGKIRAWGVSNFTIADMENLFRVPKGDRCATNQVLYNLATRGIERDLLPWCTRHGIPVMAYSPLGGPGASILRDPALAQIGAAHNCSAAAVALAWTIRSGNVIAIPESGAPEHVKENAVALSLTLTAADIHTLDAAYPPPR